jgi:hypothetical protein
MSVKKTKKTSKKIATFKKSPLKIKRISDDTQEVQIEPVIDSTGTVVMRSVDDHNEITTNNSKGTVLKPTLDKETGVLTMVPVQDTK